MFSRFTSKRARFDARDESKEFPQTFDLPNFAAIAMNERRAIAAERGGENTAAVPNPQPDPGGARDLSAFGVAALSADDHHAGRVMRDASLICLAVMAALALGKPGATLALAAYGAAMFKLLLDTRRDDDENLQTARLQDSETLYGGLFRSLLIGAATFHLAHKVFLGLPAMAAPWSHLANIALWSLAPLAALAAILPAALALRIAVAIALVTAWNFLLAGAAASLLVTDFTWGTPGRSYVLLLAEILPAGALSNHALAAEVQKTLLANPAATATIGAAIAGPALALAVRHALAGWALNRTGFSVIAAVTLTAQPLVWLGAVNLGLVGAENAWGPTLFNDAARHIATFAPITLAARLLRTQRKGESDD